MRPAAVGPFLPAKTKPTQVLHHRLDEFRRANGLDRGPHCATPECRQPPPPAAGPSKMSAHGPRAGSPSAKAPDGRGTGNPSPYLWMRAEPPFITCRTSSSVTCEVSPRVVCSKAPWAAPKLTISSGGMPLDEPVGDAAGKSVAAADAVFDLQVLELPRLGKLAVVPKDAAPIVDKAALDFAQASCRRPGCWGKS